MKNIDLKAAIPYLLWWAAAAVLFGVVHTGVDWFLHFFSSSWGRLIAEYYSLTSPRSILINLVSPMRGLAFLFGFGVMLGFVVRGVIRSDSLKAFDFPREFALALLAFGLTCLLFFPTGVHGLSEEYANTSLVMFDRLQTVNYHSRFLMPALAHFLFFRGNFFYFLFALFWAFALIFSLRFWFVQNGIRLSFLGLLSLCTLVFVYFQFTFPGYPDTLVFICVLLVFSVRLDLYARLSLFVLCLAAHEASLILWWGLLPALFFSRKAAVHLGIISILYVGFLIQSAGGLSNLVGGREYGGTTVFNLLLQYPLTALLGIFFAFRGFWLLILPAFWICWREKRHSKLWTLAFALASGLVMILFGADTSRLLGWAFLVVLFSWQIVVEHPDLRVQKLLPAAAVLNLIIPPYFVIITSPPYVPAGLYSMLLDLLR
jgi:hypothetical protein